MSRRPLRPRSTNGRGAAPPPSRRNAPAASRPAFMRATDPVLRWGPAALLAVRPAGVGERRGLVGDCVVVAGSCRHRRRLAPAPRASSRRPAPPTARPAATSAPGPAGLHAALLAVLGVGALQLVPLGHLVAAALPGRCAAPARGRRWMPGRATILAGAAGDASRARAAASGTALLFFAVLDGLPGRVEARRLAAAARASGSPTRSAGSSGTTRASAAATGGRPPARGSFGPYVNRNHFACLMGMTVPLGVGFLLSLGHRRRAAVRRRAPRRPPAPPPVAESRSMRGCSSASWSR